MPVKYSVFNCLQASRSRAQNSLLSPCKKLHCLGDRFPVSTGLTGSVLLAADDLGTLDPTGRVSRVHHQLRLLDNPLVVVIRMIGHDQDAIVLPKIP